MKRHTILAGIAVLAVAMGGCAAGPPSPDPTEGPAASAEVNRDAILRVGYPQVPVNLDPAQSPTFGNTSPYLDPIYDRLIQITADGNLEPMLATSWEFIDGGARLQLSLRDDVQFSDGSDFNADVVKVNIDRYRAEPTTPVVRDTVKSIESVEIIDDHTVDIILKPGEGADLPIQLADTAGYMVSGQAINNADIDLNPVGSGPYVVAEFTPDVSVRFERKAEPHWSGEDAANFAEIEVDGVTDESTLINSFIAGAYDLVRVSSNGRTAQLAASGGQTVHDVPNAGYFHVMFDPARVPAFADVRVRQAVQYAIDAKSISEVTMEGGCHPTPSLLPAGRPGFVAELENVYEQDVAKARELLAEAGVSGMKLTGLYTSQSPLSDVTEAVQSMLAEIGLDVEFIATAPATQTTAWLEGGADIRVSGASTVADPGNALIRGAGGPVLLTMRSDRVDELSANLMDPSLSPAERVEQIETVNRAMVDEVLTAVICHRKVSILGADGITGIPDMHALSRGGVSYRSLASAD